MKITGLADMEYSPCDCFLVLISLILISCRMKGFMLKDSPLPG